MIIVDWKTKVVYITYKWDVGQSSKGGMKPLLDESGNIQKYEEGKEY